MNRYNVIKIIIVFLFFGNLVFSQENFIRIKEPLDKFYFKTNWSFESVGSFSVYTMDGRHTFEDFVKTSDVVTNDTIQHFSIWETSMLQYIDTLSNVEEKFYGTNHNFENKNSILTFMSFINPDNNIKRLKTNKMFVKFNQKTKLLQILYCLENETSCNTKLEEYNTTNFESYTRKRKFGIPL